MDDALKRKLADAGRILEQAGQGDWTRCHISVRVPGTPDRFYMKASKIGLEEMSPENIITVDLDGEKIEGTHDRHSEVFIHSEIFAKRPDVNAVVHTHPRYSVMFSALGKPLQAIGHPGALFSDGLPVYSDTTELITTRERGRGVSQTLGNSGAMLLQNHGIVTAAASIEQAVFLALSLEDACMMQLGVEAAGGAQRLGRPEDIAAKRKHMYREEMFRTTFAYLVRRADRT